MDDALLMRRLQGISDLACDGESLMLETAVL